jgi:hypothetical protein
MGAQKTRASGMNEKFKYKTLQHGAGLKSDVPSPRRVAA